MRGAWLTKKTPYNLNDELKAKITAAFTNLSKEPSGGYGGS